MKNIVILSIINFLLLICILNSIIPENLSAQTINGTIKGKVVEKVTKTPLPGANIILLNTEPTFGAASDEKGQFKIENIPVGRYDVQVVYIGYETVIYPEIMVGSSKVTNLNAELKENPVSTDEVVVKATIAKDKPLNDMALVSGRSFTVEEARRYAGGVDDPARLASSFAGVTTGLNENNSIVIRGNNPKGVLWRMEGIEVSNPNHFFGLMSFGGGGVSALSSMMLDNSDFLTGAFPAEYGNALSGVFDIRMKTGNYENFEHTFQLGFMGVDFASEGPIFRNNSSSYAFNYRYSTLGLVDIFIEGKMNVPIYQDLSFKFNYPTQKAGIFTLWGTGFIDKISKKIESDTTKWKYYDDYLEYDADLNMGIVGLSHKIIIGNNSYINSTVAYNSFGIKHDEWKWNNGTDKRPDEYVESQQQQFILASNIYHKFNAGHYNKTGLSVRNLYYDMDIRKDLDNSTPREPIVEEDGNSQLFRAFTQSDFRLNDNWTINLGLNYQYFAFNKMYSIEPRSSIKWDFVTNQSLSLGYGLHSRLEVLSVYMAQQNRANSIIQPNKDLDLTKAHHFVLGYNTKLNKYTSLKIESYYQYLFDVPVIPDSSYSLINMEADWYINEEMKNTGIGKNYGVDVTLEKYLHNNYYYLITTSLFQSKYEGGDGIRRNTRYNQNMVMNVLGGKEWIIGEKKNKILGLNLRFQLLGGDRRNPINTQKSLDEKEIFYDESNAFAEQGPLIYHTFITLTYRVNKSGYSHNYAFQLYNFPGSKDFLGYDYNIKKGKFEKQEIYVFFPLLSYKIEF